jgi:uncharacterized membrane protein
MVAVATTGLGLVGAGLFGWIQFPAPFVWTDVAVVYFLASLPLAATIAAGVRSRVGTILGLTIGITCLVTAVALWSSGSTRTAIAIVTAIGLMLVVGAVSRSHSYDGDPSTRHLIMPLFGLGVLAVLPWVYLEARRIRDDRELAEFLDQSRLGDAQFIARQALLLDANRTFRGKSLRDVLVEVNGVVRELEARAAYPLPAGADVDVLLGRARDLAMLGRTEEALPLLEQAMSSPAAADALLLLGTIYQVRQQFSASADAFRRGADLLEDRPASTERTTALVSAYIGIAFAQRKLGRNAASEVAYQQALELDPSADNHFLLAQFYESAQQAVSAQHHARQAARLAPERYAQRSSQLVDRLITHHFGCWGASSAEWRK